MTRIPGFQGRSLSKRAERQRQPPHPHQDSVYKLPRLPGESQAEIITSSAGTLRPAGPGMAHPRSAESSHRDRGLSHPLTDGRVYGEEWTKLVMCKNLCRR